MTFVSLRMFGASVLAAIASTINVPATVRHVNVTSANPESPFTNWATAATTIQDAIAVANDGDTVTVQAGVYYENISYLGKTLVVSSDGGPGMTIIDGSHANSVVTFAGGEGTNTLLNGFTITNGHAPQGGGIYCTNGSPVITNCIITGSSTLAGTPGIGGNGGDGGGIYASVDSSPRITGCIISNNATGFGGSSASDGYGGTGGSGGGVFCYSANIIASVIADNRTGAGGGAAAFSGVSHLPASLGGDGGGIYCSSATVRDCLIQRNATGPGGQPYDYESWLVGSKSGRGGGLFSLDSSVIERCTISQNRTEQGTSAFYYGGSAGEGGGIYAAGGSPVFRSCSVLGNVTGAGSSATDTGGAGGNGAGLYAATSCSPVVSLCKFMTNTTGSGGDASGSYGPYYQALGGAGGSGGGAFCFTGTFSNCIFTDNRTGDGGSARGAGITNNPHVGGNGGYGAGVYSEAAAVITSCLLASNSTGRGGDGNLSGFETNCANGGSGGNGSGCWSADGTIANCTILGNALGAGGSVDSAAGIAGIDGAGGGIWCTNVAVVNSILWNNAGIEIVGGKLQVTYSDVRSGAGQPWFDPANCLEADPQFANPGLGDWHLTSTSPCINAGTNQGWMSGAIDLDGNPRISYGVVDMGAFEGSPLITSQPQSLTVAVGSDVIFNVSAIGAKPLSYQWIKDGTNGLSDGGNVSGATSDTLTVSGVLNPDEGDYSVRITNATGAVLSSNAVLTVICPPVIVMRTPPDGQTNVQGSTATFVVTANGDLPLSYQWYKGGVALNDWLKVSGATTTNLQLSLVTTNDAGSYTVVVTNLYGSATGGPAALTVTAPMDTVRPAVSILAPRPGLETNYGVVSMTGVARDNLSVELVWAQVGSGAWQSASVSRTRPYTANWNFAATLAPGANMVRVKALDASANESKIVTNYFFYRVAMPLSVAVVHPEGGTLTPNYNGSNLFVGRSYAMTAVPNSQYLFSNWVHGVTGVVTNDKRTGWPVTKSVYSFQMESNLTLTVNFVTNSFIRAAGTYKGLYSDPAGVAHQSAGFIKIKTDSRLNFSGNIYVEGEKVGFSGIFDLTGVGTLKKPAVRRGLTEAPLYLTPQLDLSGGGALTGTVSSPSNAWTADLVADRSFYSATNPPPMAGQYTMILPGSTNVSVEPGGDGYACITVESNGRIKTAGYFADGESVKLIDAPVSQDGRWPFYAYLYKYYRPATNPATASGTASSYNGSVLGWLTFTNGNVHDDLFWTKTGWTNGIYNGGFSNQVTVIGSPYTPPVPLSGVHVIAITNGLLTLQDGNLSSPITSAFFWTDLNRIAFDRLNNPNSLKLSVNVKDGSVSGYFAVNTNAPNVTTKIHGAVLQNTNVARGVFKGTNQTGAVRLRPQ